MEWGSIRDWEAWEELVSHCYLELGEAPSEQPVFLTESQISPFESRSRVLTTMFETFDVPAFFMASQSVLALYASGRLEGTIVNIGEGETEIVPFIHGEGIHLKHAATTYELSGRDVTEYLSMLLGKERNLHFYTKAARELIRDMKEHLCYVPLDFEAENARAQRATKKFYEVSYQLPSKQFIEVGSERFLAPEIFFRPLVDVVGIHQKIFEVIQKCDLDARGTLYNDIILAGGSTMIKGFGERLERELKILAPNAPIQVHQIPHRHYLAWQGYYLNYYLILFFNLFVINLYLFISLFFLFLFSF